MSVVGEVLWSRDAGLTLAFLAGHDFLRSLPVTRWEQRVYSNGVGTAKSDAGMRKNLGFQGDLFSHGAEKSLPPVAPDLWDKLARSAFRRKFHLNAADLSYLQEKTLSVVLEHGADFIAKRLAPAHPSRDGKQTPWKGHPVFVAQHATGTCCRSCLEKWHHLSKGLQLTSDQQRYVLAVLAGWLEHELIRAGAGAGAGAGAADPSEQGISPDRKGRGAD